MTAGHYRLVHIHTDKPGVPPYTIRVGTSLHSRSEADIRTGHVASGRWISGASRSPPGRPAGWLGHATRPIAQIIDTTARLHPTSLEERLPLRGTGDELDRLSATINGFLGRSTCAVKVLRPRGGPHGSGLGGEYRHREQRGHPRCLRSGFHRQEGAADGRRHPQHLRHQLDPRSARHGDYAENGKQGSSCSKRTPMDMVLWFDDVQMDGLTATVEIQRIRRFKRLRSSPSPQKAMKGDREKALEARAFRLRYEASGSRNCSP